MKLELIPVVRYWDYGTKEIFTVLERFRESGADTISVWVPWSHLETDRLHLLQKFVRQVMASGMSLRLGITPELGLGYANGGVPDDLLRDPQNLAQDRLGHPFYACVPPNMHPLVSLLAPAVFQRYGHFLLKLTQELTEVFAEGMTGNIELVVTDSFFKHYRNAGMPASDHGDYSLRHTQYGGYRKEEWTPLLAEKIFHTRAYDFLESRFARFKHVKVSSKNLFARDASYGRLLEELIASGPNYNDLFRSLVKARATCSVAWFDDLRKLKDRERNFLLSSSVVIFDEIWLNEQDYFALTNSFRTKLRKLGKDFSSGDAALSRPAISFVQNRFAPARISSILQDKLGSGLKFKTSLNELTLAEKMRTKLFTVEEGYSLEIGQTRELFQLAKDRDCTVVVFKSSLCEAGIKEFRKLKTFRLNHGWFFEIGMYPDGGHVLLIEGQESANLSMDTLGDSLLSVARIDPVCSFDRANTGVISLAIDWREGKQSVKTIFLMNPHTAAQKLTLEFGRPVRLFGTKPESANQTVDKEACGRSFETELPALSVIPLHVAFEPEAKDEELDGNNVERSDYGTQAELA